MHRVKMDSFLFLSECVVNQVPQRALDNLKVGFSRLIKHFLSLVLCGRYFKKEFWRSRKAKSQQKAGRGMKMGEALEATKDGGLLPKEGRGG